MTWISQELLKTQHRWNPFQQDGVEGTGTCGGWEKSEIRAYMKETIKSLIPAVVRNAIREVTKYTKIEDASGTIVNDVATIDDVWLPSRHELFNGTDEYYESKGPRYYTAFPDNASRIKKNYTGVNESWLTRTVRVKGAIDLVASSGASDHLGASSNYSVVLGFCL